MALTSTRLGQLILEKLAHGEKSMLILVVAIRKSLDRSEGIKGDLSTAVKACFHKLVLEKLVVDVEGIYSLLPAKASA